MRFPKEEVALGLVAAFLVLRIGHVIASMTLSRGTFYSPYIDAGQLLFTFAMLASLLAAAGALEALAAARNGVVTSPGGLRASGRETAPAARTPLARLPLA